MVVELVRLSHAATVEVIEAVWPNDAPKRRFAAGDKWTRHRNLSIPGLSIPGHVPRIAHDSLEELLKRVYEAGGYGFKLLSEMEQRFVASNARIASPHRWCLYFLR
jgi:hypothetical protein